MFFYIRLFLPAVGVTLFSIGISLICARQLSPSRTAPYNLLFRIGTVFVIIGLIMMILTVLIMP